MTNFRNEKQRSIFIFGRTGLLEKRRLLRKINSIEIYKDYSEDGVISSKRSYNDKHKNEEDSYYFHIDIIKEMLYGRNFYHNGKYSFFVKFTLEGNIFEYKDYGHNVIIKFLKNGTIAAYNQYNKEGEVIKELIHNRFDSDDEYSVFKNYPIKFESEKEKAFLVYSYMEYSYSHT